MKNKDMQLMKRLLAYARPYKWWFGLVLVLMVITTGAELVKPLLIGDAIDLFTEGYQVQLMEKDEGITVTFEGKKLGVVTEEDQPMDVSQMIHYEQNYYWIEAIRYEDAKELLDLPPLAYNEAILSNGETVLVSMNNIVYEGRLLTGDELAILRGLNFKNLVMLAGSYTVMLIVGFVLTYLQVIVLQQVGQKIILAIRQEVYDKMLSLPFRFYNENPVGKLVTRVTNDTETLNEMYTTVLVDVIKSSLFLVGVLVMMLNTHVKTSLAVFLVLPLIVVMTVLFRNASRKAYRNTRNKLTTMNTFISEHLSGMRLIQLFSKEETKKKEMAQQNEELHQAGMKELYTFAIFRPTIFFLSYVAVAIALLVGGNSVLSGTMTVGALVIIISYTRDFFTPIQDLADKFNVLQSAFASAEKLFDVLDEENEVVDGTLSIDEPSFKGEIVFKNVWFAYVEEEWVLKDVSFTIKPGQSVAFVGATGAGKTSILSLISRYYDCQKGEILIDGKNIKDYQLGELRGQIGQVLQDVFLFAGDIKNNIRLGNRAITDEMIEEAAKKVNAHNFISELKGGYDAEVIERGNSLSTGQRQLISFARALAFDTKLFILDEATANIDTETESLIQDALGKMMEGRTTLMVAHRLSTIQNADQIVVLHKGEVREVGDHQQLLHEKGLYYKLYELALKSQVMA